MLSEERLNSYTLSLETYRTTAGKKRGQEILQMAGILLAYCATHRLDPDNSLIGLSPSTRALQSCIEEERTQVLAGSNSAGGVGTLRPRKPPTALEGDLVLVEIASTPDTAPEVGSDISYEIFPLLTLYYLGTMALCPRRTSAV